MHDPIETHRALAPSPRRDLYAAVHKGLRAHMAHALVAAGAADPRDDGAVRDLCDTVTLLVNLCEQHLREEDLFLESALDRRVTRAGTSTRDEHRAHHAALDHLRSLLGRDPGDPRGRGPWLDTLYADLGRFVAESLAHMDREERENTPLLHGAYDDAELAAIEGALVAQIPPAMMEGFLAWMLPAMRHAERAAMLREMAAEAPPEAVAGVLALADARLGAADARALRAALSA